MSNKYTKLDKEDELRGQVDELLFISRSINGVLNKGTASPNSDADKLKKINDDFDFGKGLLGSAHDMIKELRNGRVGKNRFLLLGIVFLVIILLWII
jgi:hypothetical protein